MDVADHSQPFHCRMVINAHAFSKLKCTLQTMFGGECVCCCMFDEISIREKLFTVRTLAILKGLRSLECTAGQVMLQVMPWSSCFMVTVKGGSDH